MPNTIAGAENEYAPGIIEIAYRASTLAAHRAEASQLIQRVGGDLRSEIDAGAIGTNIQIVRVSPGSEDDAIRQLSSYSIVQSATRSAVRRLSSTTAAFTNDPFYLGIPPANNTPPLYQNAGVGGQWDMHVICAANAWGYANANTTGSTFAGARGGTVKVAIVDTGADLTLTELQNRVVFAESVLNGQKTIGPSSMHDNDGHGTNVAGIAAATGNNNYGFTGVAYNAPLLIFKVFPDPPPGVGCPPGSTSSLCTASGADVGMAISDAVAQGARVINLSLGASGPDTAEEAAVLNAIASGVVVVAASGNEGIASLDFPARDAGVIAVGASSIDDSNPSAIVESVASYSNYSSGTWGLVAPGGDPVNNDPDELHYIENLFTSTSADPMFPASLVCRPDPFGQTNDCRILDAGTSQATPHVTGAVALLLSVNGTLSPGTVKTLLCNSARNISNTKQGCGRLDVYRAMAAVVGDPSP